MDDTKSPGDRWVRYEPEFQPRVIKTATRQVGNRFYCRATVYSEMVMVFLRGSDGPRCNVVKLKTRELEFLCIYATARQGIPSISRTQDVFEDEAAHFSYKTLGNDGLEGHSRVIRI